MRAAGRRCGLGRWLRVPGGLDSGALAICMQICPLHIIREGKATKHPQSKLLIFYPFYLVFTREKLWAFTS